MARAAVLTYHSQNILGHDYARNDHAALHSDLAALRRRGIRLVSVDTLVDALLGRAEFPAGCVALSCDDGTVLDWYDYLHPQWGWQPGFDRLVRDHLDATGPLPGALTAFLIASPEARADIDVGCYGGAPLSSADWWPDAAASGRFSFGNHSWDHAHICLRRAAAAPQQHGHFHMVNDRASAERQVAAAGAFIATQLGAGSQPPRLFAYPYGHATDYLADVYLPDASLAHGVVAALTTEAAYVTPATGRFRIPRFVCGDAWRSPDEFERLLDGCLA